MQFDHRTYSQIAQVARIPEFYANYDYFEKKCDKSGIFRIIRDF